MNNVAIIGGGISGLAAAFRLRRLIPDLEVCLFEAGPRLGGKLWTERMDGFVVEGGADSFLASRPRGIGLCRELGIEDRLQGTADPTRRSYIMRDGALLPIPQGLSGLVPARLEPMLESELLSTAGKERLQAEPNVPARTDDRDESLGAFMRRRFGAEAYERLIEPLMSGIYAGNGDALSLEATFPQLRTLEQEHGSVLRGISGRPAPKEGARAGFVTFPNGVSEFVSALQGRLAGTRVMKDTPVRALERARGRYLLTLDRGDVRADAVILATPAYVAAEVLRSIAPAAAAELGAVDYASTATISLAFALSDIPRPLDGNGYIIPRREGRPALACSWSSSKFAGRAPEGYALLRVFVGRAGEEGTLTATDSDLVDLARDELRSTLAITAGPTLARVFRFPRAMPQYALGHLDRLRGIDYALAELPGVYLAGALRGIGIPDCIASGETAAEALANENIRPALEPDVSSE